VEFGFEFAQAGLGCLSASLSQCAGSDDFGVVGNRGAGFVVADQFIILDRRPQPHRLQPEPAAFIRGQHLETVRRSVVTQQPQPGLGYQRKCINNYVERHPGQVILFEFV